MTNLAPMQEISAESLEYVKCKVEAIKAGVLYNPTGDAVAFAFTATEDATGASWSGGSWETISGEYWARCLVGTGGAVQLTPDIYYVWVKITDSPEIPVKMAGLLEVT